MRTPVNRPIHRKAVRHDYYMAMMLDGTRRSLGVPIDTPTRLVPVRLEVE